jgi:hypothetical protein
MSLFHFTLILLLFSHHLLLTHFLVCILASSFNSILASSFNCMCVDFLLCASYCAFFHIFFEVFGYGSTLYYEASCGIGLYTTSSLKCSGFTIF